MTQVLQMSEPILIRSAEPPDVDDITKLAGALGYPTTIDEMQHRLAHLLTHSEHIVYVAQLPKAAVAGWIHLSISDTIVAGRQAVVNGLVVQENYRKLGIGKSLLQQGEKWASFQNCDAVLVRSNVIREDAHRFYNRLGYSHLKNQVAFRKAL